MVVVAVSVAVAASEAAPAEEDLEEVSEERCGSKCNIRGGDDRHSPTSVNEIAGWEEEKLP